MWYKGHFYPLLRPAETFFVFMRPASSIFVKMRPSYWFEFETPGLGLLPRQHLKSELYFLCNFSANNFCNSAMAAYFLSKTNDTRSKLHFTEKNVARKNIISWTTFPLFLHESKKYYKSSKFISSRISLMWPAWNLVNCMQAIHLNGSLQT